MYVMETMREANPPVAYLSYLLVAVSDLGMWLYAVLRWAQYASPELEPQGHKKHICVLDRCYTLPPNVS